MRRCQDVRRLVARHRAAAIAQGDQLFVDEPRVRVRRQQVPRRPVPRTLHRRSRTCHPSHPSTSSPAHTFFFVLLRSSAKASLSSNALLAYEVKRPATTPSDAATPVNHVRLNSLSAPHSAPAYLALVLSAPAGAPVWPVQAGGHRPSEHSPDRHHLANRLRPPYPGGQSQGNHY